MTPKPRPLDMVPDFLPPAEAAALEAQIAEIREPPRAIPLGELKVPEYGNDPDELLKHRFLYRGGILLLSGPTGVGKSSALMQAAMCWAVGKPFFGITPGEIYQKRGMRILLVQAENDYGDLAEMFTGVKAGCDELTEEEKVLAGRRVKVKTIADKSSEAFADELDALLTEDGPYDLVMVDPAFAYLGGDSNSQKDVGHFMRELLNPLLQRHKVGLVLAHHTNKPLRGKEKDGWAAGDYAYLGAGSAEWINPARAALAIRSLGSEDVFELRAAKRGKRLRWTDAEGRPTNVQYIAHHGAPGVICWRQATAEEVAEVTGAGGAASNGRPRQFEPVEAVHAVLKAPGLSGREYQRRLVMRLGCSASRAWQLLQEAVNSGWMEKRGTATFRRFVVTVAGEAVAQNKTSEFDWVFTCTETRSQSVSEQAFRNPLTTT